MCPLTSTCSHSVGSCGASEVEFKPVSLPRSVLLPSGTGITQINTHPHWHAAHPIAIILTQTCTWKYIFLHAMLLALSSSLRDAYTHTPAYMGVSVLLYGFRFVPPTQVPDSSCVYRKQTPLMNSETVAKCQYAISEFIHTMYNSSKHTRLAFHMQENYHTSRKV